MRWVTLILVDVPALDVMATEKVVGGFEGALTSLGRV
jgi:hypothetical protein